MKHNSIQRAALLIAILTSFITPFMGSAVNIALPAIGKALEADAVMLSWVATAYLLAAAVCLVPFGKLADIHGRKRIFAYGMGVFTSASGLAAAANTLPMLLICRALQGVGSAMVFATGMAILVSVFPPNERGKVLGINVAAVYIGLSMGPFLGGVLTQRFTWRSVFLVMVPLGMLVIFVVWRKLKQEWAEAQGERFDLRGSVVYGVGLIALMLGVSSLPSWNSIWLIALGAVSLVAFVVWETRVESPVFDMGLFRTNRVFALSNLAALINYSATFAVTFLLSLYLQYIKGFGARSAGLVLIAQPVLQALFSPLAGRLSDRIEPRTVASFGMGLTVVGLALFTTLGQNTNLAFIIAGLGLLGLGFAFFSSPNTNAIMSSVEKRFYGIASGAVGTMRLLGQMVSMGIVTLIFSVYLGKVQIQVEHHPAFITSARVGFTVFSVFCLLGIWASLARGRMRSQS